MGVRNSAADLGLLAEYHFDDRGDKATSPFDNDLFGAARFTFNDVQSTELLAGATVDLETQTTFLNVEGSRRLGDSWKLTLEGRILTNVSATDPLAASKSDDYLQADFSYYF